MFRNPTFPLLKSVLLPVLAGAWLAGCAWDEEEPTGQGNQFRPVQANAEALTACNVTVTADRELLVRSLGVVEDPVRTTWTGATTSASDGAWTFGRLMHAMAGANDSSVFVREWLRSWEVSSSINGFTVPARTAIEPLVISPWLQKSGGTRLDLTKAPFRLLAIVNRMDLRNLASGSAGEGRFIFGVLDGSGNATQFTVILEYNLPASTQGDVDKWAADWHALGALTPGSAAYNQALQNLTDRFAGPGVAPARINGSAISQVRTNELAIGSPWQLREFRLGPTGQLVPSTTAQTPADSFNGTATLANFINQNQSALLAGTHSVPLSFQSAPFRGPASNVGVSFFNAPGITSNEARFAFSVNTCNGCHKSETDTQFLHVSPRAPGTEAAVSGFLTGKSVSDPVSGVVRTFNDLQNRATDLRNLLCASIPTVSMTSPANGSAVRGDVTVSASASDNVGVAKVQFFDGAQSIGTDTTAPFSVIWRASNLSGTHTLTAKAFDAAGNFATSAAITTTVTPVCSSDKKWCTMCCVPLGTNCSDERNNCSGAPPVES
jgi:hypothetical protein